MLLQDLKLTQNKRLIVIPGFVPWFQLIPFCLQHLRCYPKCHTEASGHQPHLQQHIPGKRRNFCFNSAASVPEQNYYSSPPTPCKYGARELHSRYTVLPSSGTFKLSLTQPFLFFHSLDTCGERNLGIVVYCRDLCISAWAFPFPLTSLATFAAIRLQNMCNFEKLKLNFTRTLYLNFLCPIGSIFSLKKFPQKDLSQYAKQLKISLAHLTMPLDSQEINLTTCSIIFFKCWTEWLCPKFNSSLIFDFFPLGFKSVVPNLLGLNPGVMFYLHFWSCVTSKLW